MFKLALALLAAIGLSGSGSASAQSYPSKPIKLVVPFPPGAGTDTVARVVAQKLGENLGQPVVVENRAGAGGAIGAEAVAKSEPDGYTLLFVASPFTTVAAASSNPQYDPVRGFSAVALIATGPLVFVASINLPVNSMRELVELARSKPGSVNYGSAGTGSVNHLALELLRVRTGVDFVHIPYKGIGPATLDLIGGQIQTLTATIPAMLAYIKQGRVRALAVTSSRRSALLPEVPTMSEAGVRGYEVLNYWGIMAPSGTAREIVARLNLEIQRLLGAPEIKQRLEQEGVELTLSGPERFADFIEKDLRRWRVLIAEAGLRLD